MDNRTIEEIRKNETLLIEEIKGLIEENQELKKQLEVGKEQYNDLVEEKENLQEQLSNSHQINAQQKEFIEWLEHYKKALLNVGSKITIDCVLEKYKEIIGGNNDQ